jgi:hypothetical protein
MLEQATQGRLTYWLARTLGSYVPLRAYGGIGPQRVPNTPRGLPSPSRWKRASGTTRGGVRGGGSPDHAAPAVKASLTGPIIAYDALRQPV